MNSVLMITDIVFLELQIIKIWLKHQYVCSSKTEFTNLIIGRIQSYSLTLICKTNLSSPSSSLFLFSSHIKQLTNTKNKFTLMKVNGDVDAIKERKACD